MKINYKRSHRFWRLHESRKMYNLICNTAVVNTNKNIAKTNMFTYF